MRNKWRTSILNAKTLPGATYGSDYRLLSFVLCIKLKNNEKLHSMFKLPPIKDKVLCNNLEKHKPTIFSVDSNKQWNILKEVITDSVIIFHTQGKRKPWMSEDTFKMINDWKKTSFSWIGYIGTDIRV